MPVKPQADADPTEQRIDRPTPNGGVASIAYFLDDNRQSVPRSRATAAEIVEVDADGNQVFRTYMTKGGTAP